MQKSSEVIVDFPNEMLQGMVIETVIVNPAFKNQGVAVLSKNEVVTYGTLVKVYLIQKQKGHKAFKPVDELQSFYFDNRNNAVRFINHLPQMSAIELMYAMRSADKMRN